MKKGVRDSAALPPETPGTPSQQVADTISPRATGGKPSGERMLSVDENAPELWRALDGGVEHRSGGEDLDATPIPSAPKRWRCTHVQPSATSDTMKARPAQDGAATTWVRLPASSGVAARQFSGWSPTGLPV